MFIKEHFREEEKKLRNEVETKRQKARDEAAKDISKLNFDVRKECYVPECRDYLFELHTEHVNAKGEIIKKPHKSLDELNEIDFQNQVYERVFTRMEAEMQESSDEDNDGKDDDEPPKENVRDRWIKH